MAIRIGAASRIADRFGTHEPGSIIDNPSPALLELAQSGAIDPTTKRPYCEVVGAGAPILTPKPAEG